MIEIAIAVFAPLAALAAMAWRFGDGAFRRATFRWFIPLTLVWFAPFWLTGRTPAPLTFLFARIVPWKTPGVIMSKALLSDPATQFLPWREIVTQAWRHGQLPLLNRFAGSGSPLWANPQAAVMSPEILLGLPFSTFAWPLFAAVLKVVLALAGTFLFLRVEGRSERAAVFGAVGYGFGAFTFAYMLFPLTNVTVLLPWMLLAIQRVVDRQWAGVVTASCVVFLVLVGGHPESVLHVALIAIPFGVMRSRGRHGALGMLAFAALTGFLIAAPVVVPFLRIVGSTERAAHQADFFRAPALTAENLLPFLFAAHFSYTPYGEAGANFNEVSTQYVGFATFVLFIAAAIANPGRDRFWVVMFIVLAAVAYDVFPLPVPVVHGRIRFVLAFIAVVVASRAIDDGTDRTRLVRWAAAVAMTIVAVAAVVYWPRYVRLQFAPVAAASVFIVAVSGAVLLIPALRRFLVFVVFADLAILGMTAYPPVPRSMAYPPTPAIDFLVSQPRPFRFVGFEGALFPNTAAAFHLEDIRVHDPVAFEPYAAMLVRGGLDRSSYFEMFRGLPAHDLADRLGVRFIVAAPRTRSPLPVVYRGSDAVIFLNPTASPRFRTTAGANVVLERYGPASARLRVTAVRAAEVLSGEVALPGWILERNGRPWPLITRDGLVSWTAPAGASLFELRFQPPGLVLGVVLCAIGISLLLRAVWLSAITRNSSACAALSSSSAQSVQGLMCL